MFLQCQDFFCLFVFLSELIVFAIFFFQFSLSLNSRDLKDNTISEKHFLQNA